MEYGGALPLRALKHIEKIGDGEEIRRSARADPAAREVRIHPQDRRAAFGRRHSAEILRTPRRRLHGAQSAETVTAEDIRIVIACDERNEDVDERVVHGHAFRQTRTAARQSGLPHERKAFLRRAARARHSIGEICRIPLRHGAARIQAAKMAAAETRTDLFDEVEHMRRRVFFILPQRQPRRPEEHAEAEDRSLVRIDAAGTCEHRALRLHADGLQTREQRGRIARMVYARADEDGQERGDRRRRPLKGEEVHIRMRAGVCAIHKTGLRRRRRLHEQGLKGKRPNVRGTVHSFTSFPSPRTIRRCASILSAPTARRTRSF